VTLNVAPWQSRATATIARRLRGRVPGHRGHWAHGRWQPLADRALL